MTAELRSASAAIGEINARNGTRWRVVEPLQGGYSTLGAVLLSDGSSRAVLKRLPVGRLSGKHLSMAAAVNAAVDAGWPSPRWLHAGVLEAGEPYVVREFIDGVQPRRFGGAELTMLLETNRAQADLQPMTDQDWSAFVAHRVFGERLAGAPWDRDAATARLRDQLLRLVGSSPIGLPATDLVHGDCTLENTVIHDGRAYLIDAESAGKGSRAYDLAVLLVHAGTDDLGASDDTMRKLRAECFSVGGAQGGVACVADRIAGIVTFGQTHWPTDLTSFVLRATAFVDRWISLRD